MMADVITIFFMGSLSSEIHYFITLLNSYDYVLDYKPLGLLCAK